MNKIKYAIIAVFCLVGFSFAQTVNPVKWKCEVKPLKGDQAELVISATINNAYHLYSQFMEDGGPNPTIFHFPKSSQYVLVGKAIEKPKPTQEKDETFGTMVAFFSKTASFHQKIQILSDKDFKIAATVDYQVCNDETCIPFTDISLDFNVKGVKGAKAGAVSADTTKTAAIASNETKKADTKAAVSSKEPATSPAPAQEEGSLWKFFLLAVLAGLAAVFTPCVFPMIPMTVSFFITEGESRSKGIIKGFIFTMSITLIYTLIGAIVAVTKSADFANTISSSPISNFIFFALFIVFAFSFFGLYEITLPTGLSNKLDAKADQGGYISAFFMAAVLAIVSFSCTGPFVATLLVEAAMGTSVLKPLLGMFLFGFAMGSPFILLSLFPALLEKMPKSGGWLNSVKVVFAFILLAFSMKFLLNIVWFHDAISRELYLAIWIAIFVMLGLYLMGKIKFSHDSEVKDIGVFRLLLIIANFAFVFYLIPGMFGAPLKMVSAFVPQTSAQEFDLSKMTTVAVAQGSVGDEQVLCGTPKYSDKLEMPPYGLKAYFDYKEGMACAKEQGKPVFVDFKGHSCANCKKMEADVWSDVRVQALLKKYMIISLYCDDRTELPQSEWVTSTIDGKQKETIGKVNADFEVTRFTTNTLPYYNLLDNEGNSLMSTGFGYDSDVENFIKYLQDGLDAYKAKKK